MHITLNDKAMVNSEILQKNMSSTSFEVSQASLLRKGKTDHFLTTFWILYLGMIVYTAGLIVLLVLSKHSL